MVGVRVVEWGTRLGKWHAVGPVRHAVGPLRHAVGPLGRRQAGGVGWRAQKLRQFLFWRVKSNLSGPSLIFVKKNGFCGQEKSISNAAFVSAASQGFSLVVVVAGDFAPARATSFLIFFFVFSRGLGVFSFFLCAGVCVLASSRSVGFWSKN